MNKELLIEKQLEKIELEIELLRKLLRDVTPKQNINMSGIWEGADITDVDLEEAKKSLVKDFDFEK